jgi:hypothetical protein
VIRKLLCSSSTCAAVDSAWQDIFGELEEADGVEESMGGIEA